MKLSSVVKNKIISAVEYTLNLYPNIDIIYAAGSLAKGNYVDETYPEDMQKMKIEQKGRLSDIDFITIPNYIYRDSVVDLLPRCCENATIKIWTKNEGFLI